MGRRLCDVCNQPFDAIQRQQRHVECATRRTSKNDARKQQRIAHELTFIGVDGEGVTRPDGTHDYVLLSVGDQNYYRADGGRLQWLDIFVFLYDEFLKYPDAVFGGYYLGYDFAQWVRTMPESRGRALYDPKEIAKRRRNRAGGNHTPFPVYVDDWECDVLPGRRFRLRPSPKIRPDPKWMYICDVGSFFQRSFLSAINPADWPTPIVTPEQYELISAGKERRADAELDTEMLTYNTAENLAFSSLMTVVNRGMVHSGIRLKKDQWFGPGQAAQAWLNLIQCPTGEQIREVTPQWALDAARAAYYGGWFEQFVHGHIPGDSHENDEISSYPYTISILPCLLHGEWLHNVPLVRDKYVLYRAEVWGSDPHVGTMLHRTPRGTILRPHHTAGWYWKHELDAATHAGLIDTAIIYETIEYVPCSCPPPLAAIAELFEERKRVGKNTPQGKSLKLIYNSCYGKFAQSIGNPRYSNSIWASLITAGTRTRIVHAISYHPQRTSALLMVATDGVYFRTPHPTLEFSKDQLGKWEHVEKHNLTQFMPGMYWDDHSRQRLKEGIAPQLKSRGVSAKALGERVTEIDAQFHDIRHTNTWPIVDLPINVQIITPGQAIQRRDWTLAGHVIQSTQQDPIVRTISANPITKRFPEPYWDGDIIRTIPYPQAPFGPVHTTPYTGTFGEHDMVQSEDGDAYAIIAEMLGL